MERRQALFLLASGMVPAWGQGFRVLTKEEIGHRAWVAQVFDRMRTIQPGMTREKLLTVFGTEGGLSTRLRRTFVSPDCPLFKVDVEFTAVGTPDTDANERATLEEDPRDIIKTISRPYLDFGVYD